MFRANTAEGGQFASADWTTDLVWLVDQANHKVGPLSTLQLALAAKNGLLAADALIWREGLPRWFAADEVAGLLPANRHRSTRQLSVRPEHLSPTPHVNGIGRLIAEYTARAKSEPAPLAQVATFSERHTDAPSWQPPSWTSPAATARSPDSEEPFQRLRALLNQQDVSSIAGVTTPAPVPATREMLPDKAAMTSAAAASFSYTEHLARNVAESIVLVLERHRIKSIDDLASGDRLRQLAVLVVDNLPGTIRLGLGTTIGRVVVEIRIVELFEFILFSIPRQHRQRDLRDVVEDFVPQLARALEEAVAATASRVGSFVMTNITHAVASLRKETSANAPVPMLTAPAG